MRRRAILLPPLALSVLGALGFGWVAAGVIEQRAQARIEGAARAAGHTWLRAEADGTRVILGGAAPDAAAAAAAAALAADASPLLVVVDAIAVRGAPPQPPAPPPPVAVQILRDADGVALLGAAPNTSARERLTTALGEALGANAATGMLTAGERDDPTGWRMLEVAAVAAAEALRLGRVSIAPGAFEVSGLPASDAARVAIERAARALGASGVRVTLALSTPTAALGAPVVEVRLLDGVASVGACGAPGENGAAHLEQALRALVPTADCTAFEGDDPVWVAFAEAGIKALARAGGGRFRLEAREGAFTATVDGDGRAEAAVARLAAAMPEGFSLSTDGVVGGSGPSPAARATVWLRARATPDLVLLTGAAPDTATRAAVLSYAAARFGAERVHDGMAVAEAHGGDGWRAAALAGIDALAELDSGSVEVMGRRVAVAGVTRAPLAARAAHLALSDAAASGWTAESRVVVDLPARAKAAQLDPHACAAALSAQAAQAPIRFGVGSASIDADSAAALDQLAATLRRCGEGVIEIGGHTDSQGAAGYNLSLSQARAEAVRAALLERGARTARLTARGYGESAPIADNATEEGRALNRRTAFAAIVADPQAEAEPTP